MPQFSSVNRAIPIDASYIPPHSDLTVRYFVSGRGIQEHTVRGTFEGLWADLGMWYLVLRNDDGLFRIYIGWIYDVVFHDDIPDQPRITPLSL